MRLSSKTISGWMIWIQSSSSDINPVTGPIPIPLTNILVAPRFYLIPFAHSGGTIRHHDHLSLNKNSCCSVAKFHSYIISVLAFHPRQKQHQVPGLFLSTALQRGPH